MALMLDDQKTAFFDTFGFLICRGFFSDEDVRTIQSEFERRFSATTRCSSSGQPAKYVNWPNLGPDTPFLAGLLEDSRICGMIEQLLGPNVIGISCNAGSFVSETRWHPDNEDLQMHSIRVATYLQPLDASNGALRMIPGTHKNPLHEEVREVIETPGLGADEVPAYLFQSEPGDVVLFDQGIWHASCNGSTDRRMVGMQYYREPGTAAEKEAMRQTVASDAKTRAGLARDTFDSPQPEYHPHWLDNPEGSPRRQRWIDWLREWGYLDQG